MNTPSPRLMQISLVRKKKTLDYSLKCEFIPLVLMKNIVCLVKMEFRTTWINSQ